MSKAHIGIIGTGNLGARHLQALALAEESYHITVMDVSRESLEKAKTIFEGTAGAEKHEVAFVDSITDMPNTMDVVVVATGSVPRRKIIESLLEHAKVAYLVLEKVLFQRLEDYAVVQQIISEKGVKAFVNCPRRMYPVYQELKERLSGAKSLEVTVSGSNWGMGCNGIHMLDLIAHLAGVEDVQIDISDLEPAYLESKRAGYLEIAGTIKGRMGKCKAFSISSYLGSGVPVSIMIQSDVCKLNILEWKKELEIAEASTEWNWKKESFTMPYQSQLTQLVVKSLLENGTCQLPGFEESAILHTEFEKELIPYFEKQGIEKGLCPIT